MITYEIKIDMQSERELYENIVFTTGDSHGYRLEFAFYDNGKRFDLSGCVLTVKTRRADGAVIIDSGVVDGATAYYDVADNAYDVAGEAEMEIALARSDGSYATTKVLCARVREGFGEKGLSSSDNEPMIAKLAAQALSMQGAVSEMQNTATLMEQAEEVRENAESARETAEESRAETFCGYIAEINDIIEDAPVLKVNGRGGVVELAKSDVGLSNVDNTSDMDKPVSTAVQGAIDAEEAAREEADDGLQTAIDTHKNSKANPHSVTKGQVGLGNVDNTADMDKPVSTAVQGAIDAEEAARESADDELQSAIDTHKNSKANPHSVTKGQVGLGNVDNTSDMDKPVSTAVQGAIDAEEAARESADDELQSEIDKKSNLSYYTCATAASTAAKVATLAAGAFELKTGVSVDVKFTYANTASTPTLNVNGTGAKAIKMYGTTAPSTYMWQANAIVRFIYDGTYWMMQNGTQASTTYYGVTKLNSSTGSTSTTEAATPSAVKAAYDYADSAYEWANEAYDLAGNAIPQTQKAAANGVASLGADGKIPAEQLPDNGLQAAIDAKPGKKMTAGETVNITQTETATVGEGAEIFNDTGLRVYDVNNNAYGNVASGYCSHAEGMGTTASGAYSHAEGIRTRASGAYSHAECIYGTASGESSHAEGQGCVASGHCAHAEGYSTTASENRSHAEGHCTVASGLYAHAEGFHSEASGFNSHAEGGRTTASGNYSHAEGGGTTASGESSHATGYATIASEWGQFACGRCNAENSSAFFIIGNGNSPTDRSNAFRVDMNGAVQAAGQYNTTGADYAERFEWQDGNPENEDRRGLFVTLDGEKIRLANSDDKYILGVISATPSVVGDAQEDWWRGKYQRDVFGVLLTESVTVPEHEDEITGETVPEHEEERYILNPEYDAETEYISRDTRPEWAAVGMVGKLIVVDDGTCEVNGYCKAADGGIATKADNGYRVMKRVDESHVKILLK